MATVLAVPSAAAGEAPIAKQLQELLDRPGALVVDGVALPEPNLRRLYDRGGARPLWLEGAGLAPRGWLAVRVLRDSFDEGLNPAKYLLPQIQARLARDGAANAAALELLLSAGLLGYAGDVAAGRLEPKAANPELFDYPTLDPVETLQAALAQPDLGAVLRALPPPHADYQRLRAALQRYRVLADAGGWRPVPEGPKLENGARGPRVLALRRRLAVTGEAPVSAPEPELFDAALDRAVRAFQRRHGLAEDGVVGPRTLAALNTSVEARIRQIQMNMERWRWLPRDLGPRYVFINAADFTLEVVENGVRVLDMAVIVGRPYRRTPIFSSRINYLVLNPDWVVPPRIARQDLLPKIRKVPGYLNTEGFEVLSGWSEGAQTLDPATIDWAALEPGYFPYKLRQRPGPNNALGRVKFMLPNRYNVYLHDTPARELFQRPVRSFSSGCVRLSEPMELAEYLLRGAAGWDAGNIARVVASGETRSVNLPVSIAAYFAYFTAWVGTDGEVQFRDDVYGRDAALFAALRDQLIIETSEPALGGSGQ